MATLCTFIQFGYLSSQAVGGRHPPACPFVDSKAILGTYPFSIIYWAHFCASAPPHKKILAFTSCGSCIK